MLYEKNLILLRGVSGCGKSTIAQFLVESTPNLHYAEADMYFMNSAGDYVFNPDMLPNAHAWCRELVITGLKAGCNMLVSNTSTTEKEVQVYQDIAEQNQANFISLVVENRHQGYNQHNVPLDVIARQRNRFSIKL